MRSRRGSTLQFAKPSVRVDGDVVLHAQRIAEVPDDALGLGDAAHPVARCVAANELHEAVGEDHPPRPVDGDEEIALGVGPILRFFDEDVVPVEALRFKHTLEDVPDVAA